MSIVPPSRPQKPRAWAEGLLHAHGVTEPLAILGVRGYYRDSMGVAGQNDRGIYDDAIFVISPNTYATFNGNTDPSITRPHMAMLLPGVWRYQKGMHHPTKPNGYMAFTQAAPVTVMRDNEGPDTGYFGINIHRGGYNTTSSEGCQTIFPAQWDAMRELVYGEIKRLGMKSFPYCLVEEAG